MPLHDEHDDEIRGHHTRFAAALAERNREVFERLGFKSNDRLLDVAERLDDAEIPLNEQTLAKLAEDGVTSIADLASVTHTQLAQHLVHALPLRAVIAKLAAKGLAPIPELSLPALPA